MTYTLLIALCITPLTFAKADTNPVKPDPKAALQALTAIAKNQVVPIPRPDFDQQVLTPLQVSQAAVAARLAQLKADCEAQGGSFGTGSCVVPPPAPVAPAVVAVASGSVQSLIVYWANYYGVSSSWLLGVAYCESGYNPNAINYGYYAGGGNPSGVFQFLPDTFARYTARAGFVGYIFNASDNVRAAAYAFSVGGSGEWECK